MISQLIESLDHFFLTFTQRHFYFMFFLLFSLTVMINGLGIATDTVYFRLAQDPFKTRLDIIGINYFQENLLMPLIFNSFGISSLWSYTGVCFGSIAMAQGLFILYQILFIKYFRSLANHRIGNIWRKNS